MSSLREIGGMLVKRGTAMGPLVPSLVLCPVFLFFAWLFRSEAVVAGIPVISVALAILVVWIVVHYHLQYSRFARNDPERLQSEEYRYRTTRLIVAAKGLPYSVTSEELSLNDPADVPEPEELDEQPAGSTGADEESAP